MNAKMKFVRREQQLVVLSVTPSRLPSVAAVNKRDMLTRATHLATPYLDYEEKIRLWKLVTKLQIAQPKAMRVTRLASY